ncbi:hypothetical protein L486_06653 [Kwoniella mangroviensis CBS 10435]|uniref:FUN14 family protein n=1 Tax=Kwoniella mangroviensis CBS 10435 TaxID=1331196 RepID=A0A1B9IK74_9TREE|nr:hypothetical protein L486_06653 [Kwoniella mangroviensis CBS 10435]OCF71606.1 hypothetical protein I204_07665 [Kwoniella mangroviensis CBS 8886]
MSFTTSFLPALLHARPSPTATSTLRSNLRSFHPPPAFRRFQQNQPRVISLARSHPAPKRISPFSLGIGAAVAFTSLSLTLPNRQVRCESVLTPPSSGRTSPLPDDPQPGSILSVYELSFGAVCGICSGVFIKKGARAIAFLLGGVFILLQYLSSKSYIHVDWAKLGGRYDSTFGSKTSTGGYKGPTVGGVYSRIVDFLTSNFQQRASFLAGLVLGLRLG